MLAKWMKKRALHSAVASLERWQHAERPVLLARPLRNYEQRFVVQSYYRPTGYVWKQSVPIDLRQRCAATVRLLRAEGRDIGFQIAYYGLIYRLDALNDSESGMVSSLLLSDHMSLASKGSTLDEKARTAAFDLLLIQHAVQAWGTLSANAEYILRTEWANNRLKDLAGDMAVQCRYQQVMLKIFQNRIEPTDIIPVSKAATIADEAFGGESSGSGHYRGIIAAMEGDLDSAIEFHAGASNTGYRTQFMRAGANVISLSDMRTLGASVVPTPARFQPVSDKSEQSDCSLIACDKGYFYQFFDGFAESFSLMNPGGLLHLHGVGFKPDLNHIAEAASAFGIEINVSCDDMDMSRLTPDMYKGYAAGARYLFLPTLLESYERIIVHDIDGVLEKDMHSIWASSDADIQISSLVLEDNRRGHFAFWSNIGAGAFAITRSSASLKFANALSNYLSVRFRVCEQTGGRYFFTDQVGLLLATLAYKDDVSIARMPQIFSQSDETRNTGRGKAKKAAQAAALEKQKTAKI